MWFFNSGCNPVSLGNNMTIYPKCKKFIEPQKIMWFKEEGEHGKFQSS